MKKKLIIPLMLIVALTMTISAWFIFSGPEEQIPAPTEIEQEDHLSPDRAEEQTPPGEANDGAVAASGAPQISLPENLFDFGKVTRGAKLTHNFKVRNTGDAPLKIIKAKGG